MSMPCKAFSIISFFLAFVFFDCHVNAQRVVGVQRHSIAPVKHHKPKFMPGPWNKGHATFYDGDSTSFGGACGYEDVVKQGYGIHTAAVSPALYKNCQGCGSCYEIKCSNNPQWCKHEQSLFVTATNQGPPSWPIELDNGWSDGQLEHFDIARPVFSQIAEYLAGIVPIEYRRVPCQKQGGIRFTINGNPHFNLVSVWNVAGAGDVISVQVKGDKKLKWTALTRNWGQKWQTDAMMVGESLTFRVKASDGRSSTSWHVVPKNWQFGQTFEGKNFK
ncbi:hypothetical protein Pint_21052 [Pistacia integerrima]|uniref:Uncharacterized protein n=1 Tax=Pistacia integerrima TaxID=434235 RepID=A0ACC0XD73_9ROSI|nr:hypothetical protein Pint_21052 [Pistacia integerrima]